MKQRAHLLGLLVVTLLVGGGYLQSLEGLVAISIGVILGGALLSFLAERADPPRDRMRPGTPMRLAHFLLILKRLGAQALLDHPIYLQHGVTFAPAGSLFTAQLGGQRVLVLDIAQETPDGTTPHAQGPSAAPPPPA